ncbi:MAG: DUF58 domain-containing protein [Chloroflexi bacterium]|nr:DUF58 domain-containing protein [Chloroflexota bacterium]
MNTVPQMGEQQPGAGLLEPGIVPRLTQLQLVYRRRLVSSLQGERRSLRRGTSIEFVDHREYVNGDDLRQIDWNVYGRLNQLVLKRYEDEERLTVHLILDGSQSMAWGTSGKLAFTCQLAGALGLVALNSADVVEAYAPGTLEEHVGPIRGKGSIGTFWRFLQRLRDRAQAGSLPLSDVLSRLRKRHSAPGLLVVFSDLFDVTGYEEQLVLLRQQRHEVMVFHTLAPEELRPAIEGDYRLIDSESGEPVEVTIDSRALAAYHERLENWQGEVASFCRKHGIGYFVVDTGCPLAQVLFRDLQKWGVLR